MTSPSLLPPGESLHLLATHHRPSALWAKPEEDRASATGIRQFHEVWACRFATRERTDRQTFRHAHRNTSHLYRGGGGEVKIVGLMFHPP